MRPQLSPLLEKLLKEMDEVTFDMWYKRKFEPLHWWGIISEAEWLYQVPVNTMYEVFGGTVVSYE